MTLRQRYQRLSVWNKLGFWGAIASIFATLYTIVGDTLPVFNSPEIPINSEDLARLLDQREDQIRAKLSEEITDATDRKALEAELQEVESRRANLSNTLQETQKVLSETRRMLDDFQNIIPNDQITEAQSALEKGNTQLAEALYRIALHRGLERADSERQRASEAAYQLGVLAEQRIDLPSAYSYYTQALELAPVNVTYLESAATIANKLGRYDEIEPLLRQSFASIEHTSGPDHPNVADASHTLALIYLDQGRDEQAQPLLMRALKIMKEGKGQGSRDYARVLSTMAVYKFRTGLGEDGERMLKEALHIYEKSPDETPLEIQAVLQNLGNYYLEQNRYEDAEKAYKQALLIIEREQETQHPEIAGVLMNLAIVYRTKGAYEESEKAYGRAEELIKGTLGSNDRTLSQLYFNRARLYLAQDRFEAMGADLTRALDLQRATMDPHHPAVRETMQMLAYYYYAVGRDDEAESLLGELLAVAGSADDESLALGRTLNEIGTALVQEERYLSAKRVLMRAVELIEERGHPYDPLLAIVYANLAELSVRTSSNEDALEYCRRGIAVLDRFDDQGSALARTLLANFASLLRRIGSEAEAALLESRAARRP